MQSCLKKHTVTSASTTRLAEKGKQLITFGSDTTLRWACRGSDLIVWARFEGLLSPPGKQFCIADIWELKDGNFVTLTNRDSDLPDWFELHPSEAANLVAFRMMQRLNNGHVPGNPVEGPNLWRVMAGDRIAWMGPSRPGLSSNDGILEIVSFKENALICGEPIDLSDNYPQFGGFDQGDPPPETLARCRAGWEAINRLGTVRVASMNSRWILG